MAAVAIAVVAARPVPCKTDKYGYCESGRVKIELKLAEPEVDLKINVGLGSALVIDLPSGMRVKGKVEHGNKAVFQVEVPEPIRQIKVRPIVPPGATPADIVGFEAGNLQFETERGFGINVLMRVGYLESSVHRLTFTSKEIAAEEERFEARCEASTAVLRGELDEGRRRLRERAQEQAEENMAHAVMRGARCRHGSWTQMRDHLWVHAERLCEVGTDIYIVFKILNRAAQDKFRVSKIDVVGGGEEGRALTSSTVFRKADEVDEDSEDRKRISPEDVVLSKDQEIRGTVRVVAKKAPSNLTLRVVEAGGKQRVVDIEGLKF